MGLPPRRECPSAGHSHLIRRQRNLRPKRGTGILPVIRGTGILPVIRGTGILPVIRGTGILPVI